MLEQITDAPWEHDDKVVLQEKWRAANARADKCESLKGELDRIHKKLRSREVQKLSLIEKTAISVEKVATIAIKGLYPTGLLSEDFQWFVEPQTVKLPEILNQIREEICSIANCPEFLFKEYTKESKVLITLIQSKRWGKLLPLFEKQADCLVRFSRGFVGGVIGGVGGYFGGSTVVDYGATAWYGSIDASVRDQFENDWINGNRIRE